MRYVLRPSYLCIQRFCVSVLYISVLTIDHASYFTFVYMRAVFGHCSEDCAEDVSF